MFELNATFIIFDISFLLFMMALNHVFLKPAGAAIASRNQQIRDCYDESKKLRSEAEQILVSYEKHLQEVRGQAQTLISDAVGNAQKKRDIELQRVHKEGSKRIAEAKQILITEKQSMFDDLVEQEVELTKEIIRKLIGNSTEISIDREAVRHALQSVALGEAK